MKMNAKQTGFTIVELLIVIVVIAILASISIVAYNGIQNRAADSSVQSDLKNIGNKIRQNGILDKPYPTNRGDFVTAIEGMTVNKNSYGAHYTPTSPNGEYNLLFCFYTPSSGSSDVDIRLVAASKSGKVFQYDTADGAGVKEYAGNMVTNTTLCPARANYTPVRVWIYSGSTWPTGI